MLVWSHVFLILQLVEDVAAQMQLLLAWRLIEFLLALALAKGNWSPGSLLSACDAHTPADVRDDIGLVLLGLTPAARVENIHFALLSFCGVYRILRNEVVLLDHVTGQTTRAQLPRAHRCRELVRIQRILVDVRLVVQDRF